MSFEGDQTIVLVHLLRGNLAVDDPAEQAAGHTGIINQSARNARPARDHDPGNGLEIGPDTLENQAASHDDLRHRIGLAGADFEDQQAVRGQRASPLPAPAALITLQPIVAARRGQPPARSPERLAKAMRDRSPRRRAGC